MPEEIVNINMPEGYIEVRPVVSKKQLRNAVSQALTDIVDQNKLMEMMEHKLNYRLNNEYIQNMVKMALNKALGGQSWSTSRIDTIIRETVDKEVISAVKKIFTPMIEKKVKEEMKKKLGGIVTGLLDE